MKILGIEHVQIAIPLGSQDRARAFYSEPKDGTQMKKIWIDDRVNN